MTKDLAILIGPDQPWMTTEQFFEAIRVNLERAWATGPDRLSGGVRRADVLASDAQAEDAGGNALEQRHGGEQAHRPGCPLDPVAERGTDHPAVNGALHALDDPHRGEPPLGHLFEQRIDVGASG